MKVIVLLLYLFACSVPKSALQEAQTGGFSALLFEDGTNTPIYYANAKAMNLKGDSISMVTSGDEGMIFFPNLPNEFILTIDHPKYLNYTDTIRKESPRIRGRIDLVKR